MTVAEFAVALKEVLKHEGGYVNHPKDPGGPTNKGVTQRVYDDYRKSLNFGVRSVKEITEAELQYLYRQKYWNLHEGDRMPAGIGYVVFDGAVNSGVSQSVKWLQRALHPYYTGVVDGLVGPGTLGAIEKHPNHIALIHSICNHRMVFLKSLKIWPTFGRGWTNRVNSVRETGAALAAKAALPLHILTAPMETAKATVESAVSPPSTAVGDGAVGAGGLAAVLAQAVSQLTSVAAVPGVDKAIAILTIGGVVLSLAGFCYRWWAARKAKRLAMVLA